MKFIRSLALFSIVLLLSGCASLRVTGEVQSGRQALLTGKPDVALAHFRRAAELNPQYVYKFSPLQQGIWTYVGKSYYETGNLTEARQALQRADSASQTDHLAKVYLGLTLAKNGQREQGLKELESGIKGLHDWLEWIESYTMYGQFWDPSRKIRSEIQRDLAMISGRDIEWQQLIASGEWIGRKMEEEIDLARRDEIKERTMEGDDNDGGQP